MSFSSEMLIAHRKKKDDEGKYYLTLDTGVLWTDTVAESTQTLTHIHKTKIRQRSYDSQNIHTRYEYRTQASMLPYMTVTV